jgi:hypothetical protein
MLDANQAAAFLDCQAVQPIESVTTTSQVVPEAVEVRTQILLAGLQLFAQCDWNAQLRYMDIINAVVDQERGQFGRRESLLSANRILPNIHDDANVMLLQLAQERREVVTGVAGGKQDFFLGHMRLPAFLSYHFLADVAV